MRLAAPITTPAHHTAVAIPLAEIASTSRGWAAHGSKQIHPTAMCVAGPAAESAIRPGVEMGRPG
jgi:hypothetical protein